MVVPSVRRWSGAPAAIAFSAFAVVAWGYFVWTGTVSTIWPMLGVCNQLLAAYALAIGTSVLINMGRARYVPCTLVPLAFMCVNTLTAGWMNLRINYLRPQFDQGAPSLLAAFARAGTPARIQCVVTLVVMALLVVVMTDSVLRWIGVLRGRRARVATTVLEPVPEPAGV